MELSLWFKAVPSLNTAISHSFVFPEGAGKVTLVSDGKGNKSEAQIDFWGPDEVLAYTKGSSLEITSHAKGGVTFPSACQLKHTGFHRGY